MTPRKFHTSRAYLAFERVICHVETSLRGTVPAVLGYEVQAVERRIVQRLVDVGLLPFVRECAKRDEAGVGILPTGDMPLRFAGISVDMLSGRLRLGFGILLRALGEFFAHWLQVGWVVVSASLGGAEKKGAATLLFGVGLENLKVEGSDSRFVEFCRQGPITPLSKAGRLIIQTALKIDSIQPARFEYARFPLFKLARENPLSPFGLMGFLVRHIYALGAYLFAVIRYPLVSILGRDFAYHAMLMRLNRDKLIESVVITNSNYSLQPLWMSNLPERQFQTHMVWYSQNTIPLVYANDPVRSDVPNYRHMRVDISWVWTEEYAGYLRSLGIPGDILVIGPILWQLPSVVCTLQSRDDLTLVVFDVTPVSDEIGKRFGLFGNYYSATNMRAFIHGIMRVKDKLEESSGKRVRVLLKHKRGHSRIHDCGYILLVEELQAAGKIEFIPFDTNIYSLIMQADLVIVAPYSSPAYIANHLGIPSTFYDPSKELLPTYDKAAKIGFAAGEDELLQATLKIASRREGCAK